MTHTTKAWIRFYVVTFLAAVITAVSLLQAVELYKYLSAKEIYEPAAMCQLQR